jgi:hypothetical protein
MIVPTISVFQFLLPFLVTCFVCRHMKRMLMCLTNAITAQGVFEGEDGVQEQRLAPPEQRY